MPVVEAGGILGLQVGALVILRGLVTGNLGSLTSWYGSWVLYVYLLTRLLALALDSSNNLIHPCNEVGESSVCR